MLFLLTGGYYVQVIDFVMFALSLELNIYEVTEERTNTTQHQKIENKILDSEK